MSEEILAGRNSVTEALRSGRSINKLLVQDGIKGGSVSEIIGLAKTAGVVLEFCKAERLDKLADGLRHQGFVALAAPIRFHSLEEVLALAKEKDETPFLLLLDELQDPQNVGALIRTADAAGVHGVLLPKRRSCPLNAVVAKISAGAVEYVPVVQIGNIPQTIEELKKLGFWIAGADMNGEDYYKSLYSLYNWRFTLYSRSGVSPESFSKHLIRAIRCSFFWTKRGSHLSFYVRESASIFNSLFA